ncbi:uncharacterized protein Eint_090020 [Encephalitozoon intestinalis ATCC 50506]|uniref:Leucine-rich repeat domain-containing protein n=1 Tax=Encephalitozoon intestinalis (strain ATCC 50506) TaxID=876142 RepID=E0S915_ENCIT|nr:uncharacterized protein Eint_090020 [Encephalitozoon intestinalis ATCC 50506]ADM12132.2 hypothetical protein Eint_090020 [Encephalitozoon intestinalis ATCC 50506]UTX45933.1 leucine rich repeat domain-containing protein [Encephalitozoon intestinalis]
MRLGTGVIGAMWIIDTVFSLRGREKYVCLNYSGRRERNVPREVFESIMRGEKIIELDISRNNIDRLPPYFEKLSFVKVLDASNNELKYISDSILGLASLEKLNLNNNNLLYLPKEITLLEHLEELSVRNNQLRMLPEEIHNMDSLVRLDLGNNELAALPFGIGALDNLRILNLEGNLFNTLPLILGYLENLEKIIFTKNKRLRKIPRKLIEILADSKSLVLLDLRGNNRLREESSGDNVGWKELKNILGNKVKLSQEEEN